MTHGLLAGFLRLTKRAAIPAVSEVGGDGVSGTDAGGLSEYELSDLGITDGRISPSTVKRNTRSGAWGLIDQPPRWL
jgi:hypothetical protein